jgi:hypothetical protein
MDKIQKKLTNEALDILRVNGFMDTEIPDDAAGYYFHLENKMCEVWVRGDDLPISPEYYYEVEFKLDQKEWVQSYSKDLNIFWLIGFLTYFDLMPKDYDVS